MTRSWIAPAALLLSLAAVGGGLTVWKHTALERAYAASAAEPEPVAVVTAAQALTRTYGPTTTAIGTVLALRSITLRNELPGTVRAVMLAAGSLVEAGDVLVALDVSVEEAELAALEAQAVLADTLHRRAERLFEHGAASLEEVDRARAERDMALAGIERTRAVIGRKTIQAPFRARVGLSDLHVGQYLNEGTELTTLQGVDEAVHVDFAVPQGIAAGLGTDDTVDVLIENGSPPAAARLVAIDSRVDPITRNASVRARLEGTPVAVAPGASVRVSVPAGPRRDVVVVPVSALRRGPAGDHVFVLTADSDGRTRAWLRPVTSGAMLNDEMVILAGLESGELVAASGSFKLHDAALVAVAGESVTAASTRVADAADAGPPPDTPPAAEGRSSGHHF